MFSAGTDNLSSQIPNVVVCGETTAPVKKLGFNGAFSQRRG
ncbi:hypothetical protein [Rodentibacter caecimuris]|nr:hypothetical protein [Rodentibacter heylii]AOF53981.1 hypothetical protein AC062_1891 [Pasteurellaceae bacterium NI1060]